MSAEANKQTIERFYEAFDKHDGDAMAACYAPGASFDDPVFPGLRGDEPGAMWRMLTGRSDDLRVELAEHDADDTSGSAHWLATYTFTQTGRPVKNDVRATFRFDGDGRITEHKDDFSFHTWSRQALGAPGLLLGWTPVLRGATQKKARASLHAFMATDGASAPAP
jgi:ketosteroid isomerase-like protein